MAAAKKAPKRNPSNREGCGWFEPPASCLYSRNEAEHPQPTWYAPYYDCATCPATIASRQRCREREREAMRAYQ